MNEQLEHMLSLWERSAYDQHELARRYGWIVEGHATPTGTRYVLRNPNREPFNDGAPLPIKDLGGGYAEVKAALRATEGEAWGDLPKTLDDFMRYSKRGER